MWKVAPTGVFGVNQIRPPWASIMLLEMERPTPNPCSFVVTKDFEQPLRNVRGYAGSRVRDGYSDMIRIVKGSRYCYFPLRHSFGSVNGVVDDINQYLLDLHAVDVDIEYAGQERQSHAHAAAGRSYQGKPKRFLYEDVKIVPVSFALALFDKSSQTFDDFDRSARLLLDLLKNFDRRGRKFRR